MIPTLAIRIKQSGLNPDKFGRYNINSGGSNGDVKNEAAAILTYIVTSKIILLHDNFCSI